MNSRTGLFIALGVLTATTARAAVVRPGVPQLLDADPSVTCAVPATFTVRGAPTRALFLGTYSEISAMWDGQPERLLWPRAQLRGGQQCAAGVLLATNFGVLDSVDGTNARYVSPFLFSLVTPYGWARDFYGLWNLNANGGFSLSNLPIAPWRNVTGFAPSTNYLYRSQPALGGQRRVFQLSARALPGRVRAGTEPSHVRPAGFSRALPPSAASAAAI